MNLVQIDHVHVRLSPNSGTGNIWKWLHSILTMPCPFPLLQSIQSSSLSIIVSSPFPGNVFWFHCYLYPGLFRLTSHPFTVQINSYFLGRTQARLVGPWNPPKIPLMVWFFDQLMYRFIMPLISCSLLCFIHSCDPLCEKQPYSRGE